MITELSLDQTSTTYITLEETKGQSNASIISENYFLVPENCMYVIYIYIVTVTSKTERFTECSLCLKSNGGRKDIECENNHILCDECNNIFRSVAYSICPSCIKMKLDVLTIILYKIRSVDPQPLINAGAASLKRMCLEFNSARQKCRKFAMDAF